MAEMTKVALDAMGGDNAPAEIVKGAVDALTREKGLYIFLVGQEDAVKNELEKYAYDKDRIEVVPATEVIEMAEPPVNAIRNGSGRKDSLHQGKQRRIGTAVELEQYGGSDRFQRIHLRSIPGNSGHYGFRQLRCKQRVLHCDSDAGGACKSRIYLAQYCQHLSDGGACCGYGQHP